MKRRSNTPNTTELRLDTLFDYGLDIEARKIYYGGVEEDSDSLSLNSFHWANVEYMIRGIHYLQNVDPDALIELHFQSPGGDIYSMFRLLDTIQTCSCPIRFVGSGEIMSAASMIMVICDERLLHQNTSIMVHNGNSELYGTPTDIKIEMQEYNTILQRINDLYTENSRMPSEFWKKVLKRDLFLTAEEAVTLGLADKIIEPIKRGKFRKSRNAKLATKPKKLKSLADECLRRINP